MVIDSFVTSVAIAVKVIASKEGFIYDVLETNQNFLVPASYFSNLDVSGRRMDIDQRPELRFGSVEFEVPDAYYSSKVPAPVSHLFAIDVSVNAIRSGMTSTVCEALRKSLFDIDPNCSLLPKGASIGIMTFDHGVHFYNIHVCSYLDWSLFSVSLLNPFAPLIA